MVKRHKGGIPPLIRYRELAAILTRGGAKHLRTKGSHHSWAAEDVPGSDGPVVVTIAAHNDAHEIRRRYVQRIRQAWKLTESDGVSDADFMNANWNRGQS